MIINPLVVQGADPWVYKVGGYIYYCFVRDGRQICITVAESLRTIGEAAPTVIWEAPERGRCSRNIWAPEVHLLDGSWFIYFAADDGRNENHRMFALMSRSDDPLGPFDLVGPVKSPSDRWAIDGTILSMSNGLRYFIWSGWEADVDVRQDIYMSLLIDPLTLGGTEVAISSPEYAWEKHGRPWVNEGPQALIRGECVHIIYSASGSWTDNYCLGRLTYTSGEVLDPTSWAKWPEPVFAGTDDVVSPGHACFVAIGGEDWIVYHAARHRGAGWDRDVRAQRFSWTNDGTPNFGRPVPPGHTIS